MLLKNQWSLMQSNKKSETALRQMTMKNTTLQNLWDAAKAVLREKFIPTQAFLKKKTQIKNLTYHLKESEQEEQTKPRSAEGKIIRIKEEMKKMKIKKTTGKINKTKSWFLEKINKIDKPLARLTNKKRECIQIK